LHYNYKLPSDGDLIVIFWLFLLFFFFCLVLFSLVWLFSTAFVFEASTDNALLVMIGGGFALGNSGLDLRVSGKAGGFGAVIHFSLLDE
jgi:hypothetical protein